MHARLDSLQVQYQLFSEIVCNVLNSQFLYQCACCGTDYAFIYLMLPFFFIYIETIRINAVQKQHHLFNERKNSSINAIRMLVHNSNNVYALSFPKKVKNSNKIQRHRNSTKNIQHNIEQQLPVCIVV